MNGMGYRRQEGHGMQNAVTNSLGEAAARGRRGSAVLSGVLVPGSLGPLVLFVVAWVLYRMWEETFCIGTALLPQSLTAFDRHQVFFLFKAVGLLGGAVLVGRQEKPRVTLALYLLLAALLVLSTAGIVGSVVLPEALGALAWSSFAVGGVGMGLFVLLWFQLCGRFDPLNSIICYLAAHLVAPFVMAPLGGLSQGALFAIGSACALAIAPLTYVAVVRSPVPEGAALRPKDAPSLWRLLVLVAVAGFTFAFREPLMATTAFSSGSHTAIGSVIVSAAVLVWVFASEGRVNFTPLLRVVIPLAAIGFLLIPTDLSVTEAVSNFFAVMYGDLVDVVTVLVLANHCWRYRRSALWMFGLVFGLRYGFVFLGEGLWGVFNGLGFGEDAMRMAFGIVSAIAIALTVLLLPDRQTSAEWGLGMVGPVSDSMDAHEETLKVAQRCQKLAAEYGLTVREVEVLNLLVEGKTNTELQEVLGVSKETVRSHRRNIYTKCGAHSLDDLMDMLGLERAVVAAKQ